jgi:hypothetical protein
VGPSQLAEPACKYLQTGAARSRALPCTTTLFCRAGHRRRRPGLATGRGRAQPPCALTSSGTASTWFSPCRKARWKRRACTRGGAGQLQSSKAGAQGCSSSDSTALPRAAAATEPVLTGRGLQRGWWWLMGSSWQSRCTALWSCCRHRCVRMQQQCLSRGWGGRGLATSTALCTFTSKAGLQVVGAHAKRARSTSRGCSCRHGTACKHKPGGPTCQQLSLSHSVITL